jgi:restriction system protein
MPIPDPQALLLPVLRMMADGIDHLSNDMRKTIALDFNITSEEQALKQRSGSTVLTNRVAWALAYLNMAKAITKMKKGVYRIADRGIAILEAYKDRPEITNKDLESFKL